MRQIFAPSNLIFPLTEPLDSSAVILRQYPLSRVKNQTGEVVEALLIQGEQLSIAETCRQVMTHVRHHGSSPSYLLVETSQGVGLLAFGQFLALLLEVSLNQAVLLETLLETMSEATTIVDETNHVLYWNEAAERIYALKRHEVIGTSLDHHFASDAIRLKDALREGVSVQRVYHIPRPNTHVLINSAPVRRDGRIIGALSIEQDITELVRLTEQLEHTTAHLHNLQQEMHRFQSSDDPFFSIKGHSAALQTTIQMAKKVAQTDATVLLVGESGVGKELFAHAIHQSSRRSEQPFIAINCGAIPASLFESELFGYRGGAFTGADKKGKPGKLELAHNGTLFLDEIGELPLELQVKLLRALQEQQFYRIGGTEPITVNTRIIAATNRNLEKMVQEGKFREDLYYRLNVFSLEIPPLRKRQEDIPHLVQSFLIEYATLHNQGIPRLAPEVMHHLLHYSWPGNIRELRNVMERLSILQENGVILPEHLPSSIRHHTAAETPSTIPESKLPELHTAHADEQQRIMAALKRTYGNKKAAAKLLGISRGTLYNKLRKYNL